MRRLTRALPACIAGVLACQLALGQIAQPAAASSQSAFPQLPLKRDDPSGGDSHALLAAGLLVLVAAGALVLWRKPSLLAARRETASRMKVVETMRLPPHATLHVVHWQGEQLLVASSANSTALLARKPMAPQEGAQQP